MVVLLDAVAAEDVILRVDAGHPARVALQLLLRRRLAGCNQEVVIIHRGGIFVNSVKFIKIIEQQLHIMVDLYTGLPDYCDTGYSDTGRSSPLTVTLFQIQN